MRRRPLVGTGIATVTGTGDWQQLTLPSRSRSRARAQRSTLDLTVYQLNQPMGTNQLVDDVTASPA
jgi:hypothetical protein